MPEITVTYERFIGEPDEDSYPALSALLDEAVKEHAEEHPEAIFRHDPSRREEGVTLIGTMPYKVDPDYTAPEPEEEPATLASTIRRIFIGSPEDEPEEEAVATCETVKADDEVCGRDLPCGYHK